jgi:hypothetical protein
MSKQVKKLFQGILSGLASAGYKAVGGLLFKVVLVGGVLLYQYMDNAKTKRELRLLTGDTYKAVIINYEQNAMAMLDYLSEHCDKGIYIGYFAPTNANLYHWLYLVSNNELLTQEAQSIVKNPEPFLKIIPPFYKDATTNILQVAKLHHNTTMLSQKDYNPTLYHKQYSSNDFDANTIAHFTSTPKQTPTKVTEEMKSNLKLVKNIFGNLRLNNYQIKEDEIATYLYKIDNNVHFISILFAKKGNRCEKQDNLQKLGDAMYKIIKN